MDISNKKPLNDVWIYDTVLNKWTELEIPIYSQGSSSSKKQKKEFEPRMAHSAVQLNNYVVVFGGLNSKPNGRALISNDLSVLCMDGVVGNLMKNYDLERGNKLKSSATSTDLLNFENNFGSNKIGKMPKQI
jgi:hypothetical protein